MLPSGPKTIESNDPFTPGTEYVVTVTAAGELVGDADGEPLGDADGDPLGDADGEADVLGVGEPAVPGSGELPPLCSQAERVTSAAKTARAAL